MIQNSIPHFLRQVQPLSVLFQPLHNAQALFVMVKRPTGSAAQRTLACVAKGRMPQIVAQRNSFGQIFVQIHPPRDGSGDLGNFQRMGQSGAVVVTLRRQKHLCLMLQASECFTVHDPVAVTHKTGAQIILALRPFSAQRLAGQRSLRRQRHTLPFFDQFSYQHTSAPFLPNFLDYLCNTQHSCIFLFFGKNIFLHPPAAQAPLWGTPSAAKLPT